MGKQMRGLSDVSQKAAIAELTAIWCLANPEDLDLALSLSEAIRHQTDIYSRESKKRPRRAPLMVQRSRRILPRRITTQYPPNYFAGATGSGRPDD
ncbi:hypothetical protein JQK88_15955 [Mesorhizobium caraganae]|uniref:hypothetical protein n=1 Tax=Mesorhizobium caraganae TaxID=483206 RepID=UPI0019394494|nr:hypothetical protein [Mesorhizobium caraganae]MBM2712719.1 hypothetical protein [Mesorhizobium caraganae]